MKWISAAVVVAVLVTAGAVVMAAAQKVDERSATPLEGNHAHPGWTKLVELDLTIDECPAPWVKIQVNGIYVCRSPFGSSSTGCHSAVFPIESGKQYTKVRGMVRGYQKGTTDAFEPYSNGQNTIDDPYVDGVSITLATSPHTHVWTYASGVSSNAQYNTGKFNCPCSPLPGPDSPPFVGEDYVFLCIW